MFMDKNNDKIRGWLLKVVLAIALAIGGIGTGKANWVPEGEWLSGFDWPVYGSTFDFGYIDRIRPEVKNAINNDKAWKTIGEAQWTDDFIGGPLQYTTWSVEIQQSTLYHGVFCLKPYVNKVGYNWEFRNKELYIDATDPEKVMIGPTARWSGAGHEVTAVIQAVPETPHGGDFNDLFTDDNYGVLNDHTISFPPGAFWLLAADYYYNERYGEGWDENIRALRRPVDGCGLIITLPETNDFRLEIKTDEMPPGRNAPVPEVLRNYAPWSIEAECGIDIKNLYCKFFPYDISDVTNEIKTDVINTGEKITFEISRQAGFKYNIYEKPSGLYSYVLVATNRNGEIVGEKYASKWWQEYLDILRSEKLMWSHWQPSKVETVTYSDDIFSSVYPKKYPYKKPYEVQLKAIKNLPGFLILRDPYLTTRYGMVNCQWEHYKGALLEGPYDILIDVRNPEKVRIPCCMLGISNGYGDAMIESVEAYNRRMGLPEEGLWGTFKDGQLYFPPGSIYYYESKNPEPRRVNLNDRFNFSVSLKPYVSGIDDVIADEEENIHAPEGIYNLQGVKLSPTVTEADIKALAPGLYIINGKKTMLRR